MWIEQQGQNSELKIDQNLPLPSEKIKPNSKEWLTKIPEVSWVIKNTIAEKNKLWKDIDWNWTSINEAMTYFRDNWTISLKELWDIKALVWKEKLKNNGTDAQKVAYDLLISTIDFYLNNSNLGVDFSNFKEKLLSTNFEKVKESIYKVKSGPWENKIKDTISDTAKIVMNSTLLFPATLALLWYESVNEVNKELEKFMKYSI